MPSFFGLAQYSALASAGRRLSDALASLETDTTEFKKHARGFSQLGRTREQFANALTDEGIANELLEQTTLEIGGETVANLIVTPDCIVSNEFLGADDRYAPQIFGLVRTTGSKRLVNAVRTAGLSMFANPVKEDLLHVIHSDVHLGFSFYTAVRGFQETCSNGFKAVSNGFKAVQGWFSQRPEETEHDDSLAGGSHKKREKRKERRSKKKNKKKKRKRRQKRKKSLNM